MLVDLNADQRAAAQHDDAPLLVVAGAGTGKTGTLVYRVAHLFDRGADPRPSCCSPSRAAPPPRCLRRAGGARGARPLRRRVERVWGGTFHAVPTASSASTRATSAWSRWEIEVFQFKTVMEKVLDPETQVSLAEARRSLDEEAEPGDSLGIKIETSTFGRIAVQTAKQIIIQRVKDAERDNIYDEYHTKKGELSNGFVQRFEGGNIIVNLGRAEGIIPVSEQIFKESYKRGRADPGLYLRGQEDHEGSPDHPLPDPSRFSQGPLRCGGSRNLGGVD